MKILIIMRGYFPGKNYGGPPVSIRNFCKYFKKEKCYILTTDHDFKSTVRYPDIKNGWNKRSEAMVKYLTDYEFNYKSIERAILEIKPTVLYLQSIFESNIIKCLILAKKYKLKVLLAPRGELCGGALKQKKYKKIPYLIFLKMSSLLKEVHFQATSDEELDDIQHLLSVPRKNIHKLVNLPSVFSVTNIDLYKKQDVTNLVYISRITRKKNLLFAIQSLKNISEEIVFDIYGAKEDLEYWEICKNEIDQVPANVHVRYKGILSQEDVGETFSKYDAFIFPTSSENYGHVIVEALTAGCPVVLSQYTPWIDLDENNAGYVVSIDDGTDLFSEAIEKIINLNVGDMKNKRKSCIKYINNKIDVDSIIKEYNSSLYRIAKG